MGWNRRGHNTAKHPTTAAKIKTVFPVEISEGIFVPRFSRKSECRLQQKKKTIDCAADKTKGGEPSLTINFLRAGRENEISFFRAMVWKSCQIRPSEDSVNASSTLFFNM